MISGIYSEKHKQSRYFLSLNELNHDTIALNIVAEDGTHITTLLRIDRKTGCISRNRSIAPVVGLELDSAGRLKIEGE